MIKKAKEVLPSLFCEMESEEEGERGREREKERESDGRDSREERREYKRKPSHTFGKKGLFKKIFAIREHSSSKEGPRRGSER